MLRKWKENLFGWDVVFGHSRFDWCCWLKFIMVCGKDIVHMNWIKLWEENARIVEEERIRLTHILWIQVSLNDVCLRKWSWWLNCCMVEHVEKCCDVYIVEFVIYGKLFHDRYMLRQRNVEMRMFHCQITCDIITCS